MTETILDTSGENQLCFRLRSVSVYASTPGVKSVKCPQVMSLESASVKDYEFQNEKKPGGVELEGSEPSVARCSSLLQDT